MTRHIRPFLIALLIGVLGVVVSFAFGAVSGRGEIGVAAMCVVCLFSGVFLTQKYPASGWYGGVVVNAPIWAFQKFLADPGQFELHFWGLIACLISSYAGTIIALWLTQRKIMFTMTEKLLLVSIGIVLIALAASMLNAPGPIPSDKGMFVGVWKTGSGFELQIMSNGTASITQNIDDRGPVSEHLNIKGAPSRISGANIEFRGDSLFSVVKHGSYGREYRITRYPYADTGRFTLVLNGEALTRER